MDNDRLTGFEDAAIKFLDKFFVRLSEFNDSVWKVSKLVSLGFFLDLRADDIHSLRAYISAHRPNGMCCTVNYFSIGV